MAETRGKRQHEDLDSSEEEPVPWNAHLPSFQEPDENVAEDLVQPGPSGLQNIIPTPPSKRLKGSSDEMKEIMEQERRACLDIMRQILKRPLTPRPKPYDQNFDVRPRRTPVKIKLKKHDPATYRPSELDFNECHSHTYFQWQATATLYKMRQAHQRRFIMRKAILGLYLQRHSVCILDNRASLKRTENATLSFPHDILGKWNFPDGDTVIMVNFYADPNCVNTALMNLIDAMKAIDELDGAYTSTNDPLSASEAILENHQTCLIEGENNFKVIAPEPLSLIFKPVFTQQSYNMGSAKNRMAAEVLQAAILVFIHMIEKTLPSNNVGGALYLAQCMHRFSLLLKFLISDESLTSHYLLTMPNWYLGRCCVLASNKWMETKDKIEHDYKFAHKKLRALHIRFFGKLLQAYDINTSGDHPGLYRGKRFLFPNTIAECFQQANRAFTCVQAPSGWNRTCQLDLHAKAMHNHLQLVNFERAVPEARTSAQVSKMNKELTNVCNDVKAALKLVINELHCKIFLLNLLAKCLKYCAAWHCRSYFVKKVPSRPLVKRLPYICDLLSKQGVQQRCALALMNEVYQINSCRMNRWALLQMAELTFSDEVMRQIHAADEQYRTSGIYSITCLLPAVFAMWSANPPEGKMNQIEIKNSEIKYFYNIVGIMFNGTAMLYCLMARGVRDDCLKENYVNNAKYFHALSNICMRRTHVICFILKAYTDNNLLYQRSIVDNNYTCESMPQWSTRCLTLLLNYLLVLPVMWELCIDVETINGPQNCESIVVNHMILPIPLISLSGVTDSDLRLYSDILEQLRTETGFVEGNNMVVSHSSTSEPTLLQYRPHPLFSDDEIYKPRMFRNSRDDRPVFFGNDDYTTSSEWPVEPYHYEDEQIIQRLDKSYVKKYSEMFSNIDENERKHNETVLEIIENMHNSLDGMLIKAINEVTNLKEIIPKNIAIRINVEGDVHTKDIPVMMVHNHLHRARELLLNVNVSKIAAITQALAMIDAALNEGKTLVMLRGSINTEP